MGYCVSMEIENLNIPLEKVKDALKAINALFEPKLMKGQASGGSYSGGKQTDWNYSWVDKPADGGFKNLEEAFDAWRYSASNQDGSCEIECFTGEKLGDDPILWAAVAPFVNPKAVITCRGEDGAQWRWIFKGGKFKEQMGKVVWE